MDSQRQHSVRACSLQKDCGGVLQQNVWNEVNSVPEWYQGGSTGRKTGTISHEMAMLSVRTWVRRVKWICGAHISHNHFQSFQGPSRFPPLWRFRLCATSQCRGDRGRGGVAHDCSGQGSCFTSSIEMRREADLNATHLMK